MRAHEQGLGERDEVRRWKQELRGLRQHPLVNSETQAQASELESKLKDWYSRAVIEVRPIVNSCLGNADVMFLCSNLDTCRVKSSRERVQKHSSLWSGMWCVTWLDGKWLWV